MAKYSKKPILDLPLKIVLTDQGAAGFIQRQKKLQRFRLADNTEEYGVTLTRFAPQSLQEMILLDYISKLEISLPEFTSSRLEIMDLSKLLVYSILYKQFSEEVLTVLLAADCVKKHNRAHPGQFLDKNTKIDDFMLQSVMKARSTQVWAAKKLILEPVNQEIIQNKEYSPEEKNMYLGMVEKFLNKLTLYNWYLIILFSKNPKFIEMIDGIRVVLRSYMQKSTIAEYISLMLMELAANSENINMRKEANIMYRGMDNINMILFDPVVRQKIIDELIRKHTMVFVSWKLGGGASAIGKQGQFQITLYNKDDQFLEVKESIETKKSANLKKKTLIDFYRELPEGEGGSDLGLYYLSYLNDACKQLNVKFDSLVNYFSSSDLTVINLTFNF